MADNDQKGKKGVPKAEESDRLADGVTIPSSATHEGAARFITGMPDPLNVSIANAVEVNLNGTPSGDTNAQGFWEYLRQRTEAITFGKYNDFLQRTLCEENPLSDERLALNSATVRFRDATSKRLGGVDTYQFLRAATEAFLLIYCGSLSTANPLTTPQSSPRFGGATPSSNTLNGKLAAYLGTGTQPYVDRIVAGLDVSNSTVGGFCEDLDAKVLEPCFIELIWSYWHEEAAVVQAINAISLRFQNKRGPGDRDPLANLETHPLRPLANLLWGYVQDEDHRLTVARRAYEYEHQYGLSLVGRAVPKHAPADRRSQFLKAFHTLLHQAAIFYDRSANLTIRADAFPLLNSLREVHLILAEGAHNQFRELTWTARVEMLIQQWLLSRREVREFISGRQAVPYAEEWMRSVDAMRRLMGWGDTAVTNFHDLAVMGEKIVLSVRFGDWSDTNVTEGDASDWVVFWRPEIQRYIHAYQAVTGIDLSAATQVTNRQIDATPPSVLLQQRIARQPR